ncbi:MAG: hypothetical protein Q4B15_01980, partial [Lachnospiraceae bacterium]|nr:hypothetical protein [Lachnospiraceae bacterium]
MNIGIDFGSTYTVVSLYNQNNKQVYAYNLGEGADASIPSVLTKRNGKYRFGAAARNQSGQKGTRVFKGFKMLLSSGNEEEWEKRGFTEEDNPESVSSRFLESILEKVLSDHGEEQIEHLFIGVPEIWQQGINTIDGRTRIRNICRSFPFVKEAQVVSEPAAASAYFAYHDSLENGEGFSGRILLIDYGGGTLDITLTKVDSTLDADGNPDMEIRIEAETGAGENKDGAIGQAGIAYMEAVAEEAIIAAGKAEGIEIDRESLYKNARFYQAVNQFESSLLTQTEEVEEVFASCMDEDDLDDLWGEFTSFSFLFENEEITRNLDVDITYSLMLRVYNRVIRDVLHEEIEKICSYMKAQGIDYKSPSTKDLKIVLVGGFGNFYLVHQQVDEEFGFSAYADNRSQGTRLTRADREHAISYGTVLLANQVMRIRHTAPYSIGAAAKLNGKDAPIYAFRHRQDIKFRNVYYASDKNGDPYVYLIRDFSHIFVDWGSGRPKRYALRKEFAEKIREAMSEIGSSEDIGPDMVVIGFSLDQSEVLSMHFQKYDLFGGKPVGRAASIELT